MGIALPVVALGMSAVGAGVSAYSQWQAGKYNAGVLRQNEALAVRAGGDAVARAGTEAGRARMAGSEQIATQRARAAAGNIDVQSGSVLGLTGNTRLLSALSAENIQAGGVREALGHEAQADQFVAQAQMAEAQSKGGVAGSLLGGASSVVGLGYNAGLFPRIGK